MPKALEVAFAQDVKDRERSLMVKLHTCNLFQIISNDSKESMMNLLLFRHLSRTMIKSVGQNCFRTIYKTLLTRNSLNHSILHFFSICLNQIITSFVFVLMTNRNLLIPILPSSTLKMVAKVREEAMVMEELVEIITLFPAPSCHSIWSKKGSTNNKNFNSAQQLSHLRRKLWKMFLKPRMKRQLRVTLHLFFQSVCIVKFVVNPIIPLKSVGTAMIMLIPRRMFLRLLHNVTKWSAWS